MVLSLISISSGYKILFLVPFPGSSHWLVLQNFAKELVKRGHELTAIVNTPINNFTSPNYTEILIDPPYDLKDICKCREFHIPSESCQFNSFNESFVVSQQEAIDSVDDDDFKKIRMYDKFATKASEHGLTTPNVQKIIHSQDLHFDLVIDGHFFHESWLMFAHKFNAPMISICKYMHSQERNLI